MTTENNSPATPNVEVTPDNLWATDAKDFTIPEESEDESVSSDSDVDSEETDVQEEAEELEESSEGEEDEGEAEGESKEVQSEESPARKYRATKSDGTQVEVESDTVFKVKVNGKIEKVSFEDLKKDYNGKVYYDERIRRASEKEIATNKILEKNKEQTETFDKKLKAITKNVTSSNVLDALTAIGDLVGEDPEKFRSDMLNGMTKFITDFSNMTDEQQAVFLTEQKYNALKKERELENEDNKIKTDKQKAVEAVEQACKQFSIPKDVMEDAYAALKDDYVNRGASPDKITLDNVVDLALTYRVNDNLKQAQEEYGKELGYETFNKLRQVIFDQEKGGADLELSDYVDIIKEITTKSTKMKASSGLQKKANAKPMPKAQPTKDELVAMDLNDIWG